MRPRIRIPRPLQCGSYTAGHEAHFIQARLSREQPPIGRGTASVDPEGWITITLRGQDTVRWWTHDPARLDAQLAAAEGRVELRHASSLAVPTGTGHYIVSASDQPTPCPSPDDDVDSLSIVELVQQRGGFVLPSDDPRMRELREAPEP